MNAKSPVKINVAEVGEISSMFVASRPQQLHLQCLLGCLWLPVTNYGIGLVVRARAREKRKSN